MSHSKSAALIALAILAAALAGCGKMGALERPGPLFGHAQAETNTTTPHQDPNRPVQTVDPRDENATPSDPK
ncbi:MAG: hypothetical protein E7812_00015 [Phenylobacterium sp.]|nr:MAG: hypothetical protein E7812_00015 [Phenylobacterium sp.]